MRRSRVFLWPFEYSKTQAAVYVAFIRYFDVTKCTTLHKKSHVATIRPIKVYLKYFINDNTHLAISFNSKLKCVASLCTNLQKKTILSCLSKHHLASCLLPQVFQYTTMQYNMCIIYYHRYVYTDIAILSLSHLYISLTYIFFIPLSVPSIEFNFY
jgi:hypothetical protein